MTVARRSIFSLLCLLLVLATEIVNGQVCEQADNDVCPTPAPVVIRQNQPYGVPCTASTECASPMVCKSGVCGCPDGNELINNVCTVAPSFGAPCNQGKCSAPVLCGATGICNLCPVGFNSTGLGCVVACGINDITTPNGCLQTVTGIGGQCQDNGQCQVAFTQCINSRCTCVPGTQQIGNACLPTVLRCPSGEAYKYPNGTFQVCKSITCAATVNRPATVISGCPLDYTCLQMSTQLEFGVCCPVEKPWCPVGEPLLDKSCNDTATTPPPLFALPPPPTAVAVNTSCPSKTHFCHKTGILNTIKGGYCCPLPCTHFVNDQVSIVDGLCVKRVPLSAACQTDVQCPQNAVCDPTSRVCVCQNNFVQQVTPGDVTGVQRCAQQCNASQITIGSGCYDAVLPMGNCNFSAQCTQGGTVCRANKCQCKCGEYLQNSICIPTPTCPPLIGSDPTIKIPPLSDQFGFHDCTPTPTTTTAPLDICGRYGGYCAAIGANSFCCPLPAPNCPNGQAPVYAIGAPLACTVGAATSECSTGTYCYDYVSAVVQRSPSDVKKGVCCSNAANSIGGVAGG